MKKQLNIIISIIFILIIQSCSNETSNENSNYIPFEVANIFFEQNATDGDVEVVFEIKGGDNGLNKLFVVSPESKTVVDFEAPDKTTKGIRQFRFESPEPKDIDGLKDAYPEGIYKCSGSTFEGEEFFSECILNHNLPETTSIISPGLEADSVDIKNLEISWSSVNGISYYILEIDQDETGFNLQVKLSAEVTKFIVPDDLLKTGTEYTFAIGTVSDNDNRSFIETSFITSK